MVVSDQVHRKKYKYETLIRPMRGQIINEMGNESLLIKVRNALVVEHGST